jgi:murein DD-endopeptidase MepM/ murein hydrolase activator NlpD
MSEQHQTVKVGQRVKIGSHVGTVTGKTGEWYHIDWDDWKQHCCNYYGAWEFEAASVKDE